MIKRILVADDEPGIANPISYAFRKEGYEVETVYDGQAALDKALSFHPHVIVLDVMMPKLTGYEVCRKLDNRSDTGIILLTVKDDIVDKIVGLEMGADDYMTKPFDMRELIARVKALLRRLDKKEPEPAESIVAGPVSIHLRLRTVFVDDRAIELTPRNSICLRFCYRTRNGCLPETSCWMPYGGSNTRPVREPSTSICSDCARNSEKTANSCSKPYSA